MFAPISPWAQVLVTVAPTFEYNYLSKVWKVKFETNNHGYFLKKKL